MADEPKKEETPVAAPPKSNTMLIVIICVVCLAAGGGASYFLASKKSETKVSKKASKEDSKEEASHAEEGGEDDKVHMSSDRIVQLAPFVVNLDDNVAGEVHYLKCTLSIVVADKVSEKSFEDQLPKLRNSILLYLSSIKMVGTQGRENKIKMLQQLRDIATEILGKNSVREFFISEFVVQ